MPTITIQNQSIFYTRQGKAAKNRPALLLVHGAGDSHLSWPAELRRLPDTVVYALDLPGHGRSEGPGRERIDEYAAVLVELLAQLPEERLVVAGHSMGGAIAQAVALQGPPQLAGLVLINTGARLPVSPAILNGVQENFEETAEFVIRYSWSKEAADEILTRSRQALLANDPAVVYGDFLACDRFDARGRLDTLQLPVLVLGGETDKMTPLKFSQSLAVEIPAAQLITFPGGSHRMTLEKAVEVAQVVEEFLGECGE